MKLRKKRLLRTIQEDFPNYLDYPQIFLGKTEVKVENIIGGIVTRKEMYYSDFSIKKPDDRYHWILDLIIKNGKQNAKETIERLGEIELFCLNLNGKKQYYISLDGHRRVSLAKKFNVKRITAFIDEILISFSQMNYSNEYNLNYRD